MRGESEGGRRQEMMQWMDQRREDRNERAGRHSGPGERNGKLTDFTGKKTGRRELTFPMSY